MGLRIISSQHCAHGPTDVARAKRTSSAPASPTPASPARTSLAPTSLERVPAVLPPHPGGWRWVRATPQSPSHATRTFPHVRHPGCPGQRRGDCVRPGSHVTGAGWALHACARRAIVGIITLACHARSHGSARRIVRAPSPDQSAGATVATPRCQGGGRGGEKVVCCRAVLVGAGGGSFRHCVCVAFFGASRPRIEILTCSTPHWSRVLHFTC